MLYETNLVTEQSYSYHVTHTHTYIHIRFHLYLHLLNLPLLHNIHKTLLISVTQCVHAYLPTAQHTEVFGCSHNMFHCQPAIRHAPKEVLHFTFLSQLYVWSLTQTYTHSTPYFLSHSFTVNMWALLYATTLSVHTDTDTDTDTDTHTHTHTDTDTHTHHTNGLVEVCINHSQEQFCVYCMWSH